jgi:hypothetical protein
MGECSKLKIDVNGSGVFDAERVNNSVNASIKGSGDINIQAGELETFDIFIQKKGAVRAKGVTTNYAKIEMPGSGKAEIGRVIKESVEICGDGAEVIVHRRG